MVVSSDVTGQFWGLIEWFLSLPHFPSVLFVIVCVLSLVGGLISLLRRV